MNEKIEKYLKLPISEIDRRIKVNDEILNKMWNENSGNSWDEYKKKCEQYWDDNHFLLTAKKLLIPFKEIEFSPMSEFDKECCVPIKIFKSWCDCYKVVDNDGDCYYATKDKVTRLDASPRAFREGYIRNDFEYVCWYNK